MCDGDILVMFVKSGLISESCCPTLKYYDRAANKIKFLETEDYKLYE